MPTPSPSLSLSPQLQTDDESDDIPPLPSPIAFSPTQRPTEKQHSPFATRNIRYIRVGDTTALHLTFYLRKQHLPWFTEAVFERLIPAKLSREVIEKKEQGLADVYRARNFQMAYYLRPTEIRHSVLEKNPSSTAYTRLQLHSQALTLIVEPYDVNDKEAPPPDFLGFNYKSSMKVTDFFRPATNNDGLPLAPVTSAYFNSASTRKS
ncbi:hypothetical protein DFJ77DRAFT_347528 [Powellomyces hirtus]|nr:hypothetical protein DFJ77DRAFT_347528 [Powellomyces hirtus]